MPTLSGDAPGEITELNTSPWGQCLNGVCDSIIDLNLDGIAGNVWIRDPPTLKLSGQTLITLPAVLITPIAPSYSPADGSTSSPEFTIWSMVAVVKKEGGVINETLPERLLWYSQIFLNFAKKAAPFQLSGAGALGCRILYTMVQPGDPRILEAWKVTFDALWLQIGCRVRGPATA